MRSSDLRKRCTKRTDRQPCFICGGHESITEAHHVLPLKDVAFLLESFGRIPEPPIVWLCPNCHAYVHAFRGGRKGVYLPPEFVQKAIEVEHISRNFMDTLISSRTDGAND